MEQKTPDAPKDNLDFDERLLQITLDQLRTLVAVASTRSPRRAAQQLKRDQSSIEKQLRTLNGHFRGMADEELLIRPPQRGGEVDLTHAGQAVADMARAALASLDEAVVRLRDMQQDRPLRLALTTFLLPLLLEIQDDISLQFTRHGLHFSKELIHVRSSEVQNILLPGSRDKRIDFALGGFTTKADDNSDVLDELEFLEWKRDRIVLLINYPPPSIPCPCRRRASRPLAPDLAEGWRRFVFR